MAQKDVRLPRSFRSTHDTAGLSGFPAVDVFGQPGEAVVAPEAGNLVDVHQIPWDQGKRVGGITAYLQGADGNTYFLTHLGGKVVAGPVAAGQQIGEVGEVPGGWWQSHIHEGLHQGLYQPGSSGVPSLAAAAQPLARATQAPAAPLAVAANAAPIAPVAPQRPATSPLLKLALQLLR